MSSKIISQIITLEPYSELGSEYPPLSFGEDHIVVPYLAKSKQYNHLSEAVGKWVKELPTSGECKWGKWVADLHVDDSSEVRLMVLKNEQVRIKYVRISGIIQRNGEPQQIDSIYRVILTEVKN